MSYGVSPVFRRTFLVAAALALAVVILLGFSTSAYAASIVVDDDTGCNDATGSPSYCHIQAAVDAASPGDTINIFPGAYNETASGRWVRGVNGPHQFGLFIDKDGLTLQGVTAAGVAVDVASNPMPAIIHTNSTANFGPDGIFVQGDNVTIAGLEIGTNTGGQNKTIEIIGNGFVLKDSFINDPEGSVYFNEWSEPSGTPYLTSYVIENNIFGPGVSLDLTSGTGRTGPVSGRVIQSNLFKFDPDQNWPSISFTGSGTTVPWFTYDVGGALITDNTFEPMDQYIRARGNYPAAEFDWEGFWNNNSFPKAVVSLDDPATFAVNAYTYACGAYSCPNTRRIGGKIQPEIDTATAGDTVLVKAGTYVEQVSIDKNLTLKGAGPSTIIQSPATLASKTINGASRFPVVYAETGAAIAIKNLSVDGGGMGSANNPFLGVAFNNAGGQVSDVLIKNIQDTPFSGAQHGVGLYAIVNDESTSKSLLVKNVTVQDFQKNGMAFYSGGSTSAFDVDVTGSTITGRGATNVTAQNGIQYYQVGGTLTGDVIGNTINGIAYDNTAASTKWVATSILNFYADLDISGNTIGGGAHMGIYNIDAPAAIDGNTLNIVHAASGSTDGYGIIASDPPGVVPSPLIDGPAIGGGEAMVMAASATTWPVDITRNTVTFAGTTTVTPTVGIEADAGYGTYSLAVNATGNVVSGFSYGFYFGKCSSSCSTGVFESIRARYNSITGSTDHGMFSDTGNPIVDAEYNWWGAATGPAAPNGVSANVDADPWLTAWPASPVLSIPATPITASPFVLPVNYNPGAAAYASVAFSLDYDASCLSAPSVAVLPPTPAFASYVDTSVAGRVDMSVFSDPSADPLNSLTSYPVLFNLTFNVLPGCANPAAAVQFASVPTVASCGDLDGAGFECSTAGALIPVTVDDAPTDITLASSMVNENVTSVPWVVGALAAVDPDGPAPTFSLVAGTGDTDNADFQITGNNLEIKVSPNFEVKSVYSVRVKAQAGALAFEKALRVYVLDVNEAPMGITLSAVTLVETVPAGTFAGSLSTTGDPDAGAAHTYSIVGGPDAASFQILPGTNRLITTAALTNGNKCVLIRSTDNDNPLLWDEETECVTVLDTAQLSVPSLAPYFNVVRKGNTIAIPVDYADMGNSATNLAFDLTFDTQCLVYQSASGGTVSQSPTGTLHVAATGAPILSDAVTTITFRAKTIAEGCAPEKYYAVALAFSNETLTNGAFPLAVDGTNGLVKVINNDPRGDCNSDGKVNAGDFPAIILEIFDVDDSGSDWLQTTAAQPFNGSPYGCDANASGRVQVADVGCTVNIVFGNLTCTSGTVQAASVAPALVAVEDKLPVTSGGVLEVPVTLERAGHDVGAIAFTFKFDPALVAFDPADADGDGLPDAVQFNVKGNLMRVVNYVPESHELQVAIAGVSLPLPSFADGPVVTISLKGAAVGAVSPALKGVSLGSVDGFDVPVIVKSQGTLSGWSRILLPAVNK